MTEPTQEEYKALADILGDALDHCNEVRLYGDNLFTAYKALRIAANLPSEEELVWVLADDIIGIGSMAARILEHIKGGK